MPKNRELLLKGKAQYSWPPYIGRLFCKKETKYVVVLKAADLNYQVQGGQSYESFLFSKYSLLKAFK